jgi:hypothetical protein
LVTKLKVMKNLEFAKSAEQKYEIKRKI